MQLRSHFPNTPPSRPLGRTGLLVSPLGFGAFKIGRNQKVKYDTPYELPTDDEVARLLNGVLDLGITLIDTAPAYGTSEERLGATLAERRGEFVLSTKVGETFENGVSTYDFSPAAVAASVERSLSRLKTEVLDLVLLHSNGEDLWIQRQSGAVEVLQQLKSAGRIRAIGLSGKSPVGVQEAFSWADVVMIEYHLYDRSHEDVIAEAGERGCGVLIKKGLAAGRLEPSEAIRFLLANPHVSSVVVGGLNLDHLKANLATARQVEEAQRAEACRRTGEDGTESGEIGLAAPQVTDPPPPEM